MDATLLIIFIFSSLVFISLYVYDNYSFGYEKFTPGKVIIYFGILPLLSILTLSFGVEKINTYVFDRITSIFHSFEYLYYSALVPVASVLFAYVGVLFSCKIKRNSSILLTIFNMFVRPVSNNQLKKTAIVTCIVALFIFILLLGKIGGLASFWGDVNSRVETLGGLGYLNKAYVFLLTFSTSLQSIWFFRNDRKFLGVISILLSCLFLSILGSRSTSLALIVCILVCFNFCVTPIKTFFSRTNLFIGFFMLIIVLGIVNMRENGAIEKYKSEPTQLLIDMSSSVEKHLIMRFSRIERDVMIFNYFSNHDIWFGKSYLSLLTAPIPRSLYKDKPPIDIGMYLVLVSQNYDINFPEENSKLPNYSWPTGNSEAFMNFHIPGLILCYILSGFLFGRIYQFMITTNYHPFTVSLYGIFCFGGAVDLSTMGIVNFLTKLVFFFLTAFFCWLLIPRDRV